VDITTMISPEIVSGVEVIFKESVEELEADELLQRWRRCYKDKVFIVCQRVGNQISLYELDGSAELMHFGSTSSHLVHVGFFRLKEG